MITNINGAIIKSSTIMVKTILAFSSLMSPKIGLVISSSTSRVQKLAGGLTVNGKKTCEYGCATSCDFSHNTY